MAYNTVAEIKELLMLESENQTLSDTAIQSYLDDAEETLYSEIHRSQETDRFYLTPDKLSSADIVDFVLFFRVSEIISVRDATTHADISSDNYSLIRRNQAIRIDASSSGANLSSNIIIEVDYIPVNYKYAERAIAMVNILGRIDPFSNDQINPNLLVWKSNKKNYINMILGNFGTNSYV